MSKSKVTLKIILILIFTDLLETFTHYCFKHGAIVESGFQISSLIDALIFIKTMLLSGYLWLGLFSVLLTFVIWSTVLAKIDLSVAVPICSFSYIFVSLVAIIFFHEQITLLRWTGIIIILAGIILVSVSANKDHSVLS